MLPAWSFTSAWQFSFCAELFFKSLKHLQLFNGSFRPFLCGALYDQSAAIKEVGGVMSILGAMAQRTFKSTPQTDREHSRTRRRPIELQTENGFCIIRRCDLDGQCSRTGTEHWFVVRDPHDYELDITASFSQSAVAEAIRRSCGRLTFESAFWLICAERHLADYLWENDDYPPAAQITIDCLTPDDVDLAQRCGNDAGDEDSTQAKNESSFVSRKPFSPDGTRSPLSKLQSSPIRLLTENGYTIIRLCDIDHSITDEAESCHFRIANSEGRECDVTVHFAEALVKEIQRLRKRHALGLTSKYWPIMAEKYLANHLWMEDQFPTEGEITFSRLSDDDLLLGAHWTEEEKDGFNL
jgi:hypothetical protein